MKQTVVFPLLFLVYVNDISNAVPYVNVKLFADDTNMSVAGFSLTAVNQLANYSINNLNYWFVVNKLSINIYIYKICYMVFPSDTSNSTRLIINGQKIKKS